MTRCTVLLSLFAMAWGNALWARSHQPDLTEPVVYDGSLAPGVTVNGSIGFSNPNDPYDWYCMDVVAGQQVVIAVNRLSGDINPNVGIAQGVVAVNGDTLSNLIVLESTENEDDDSVLFTYTPNFSGPATIWISTFFEESGGNYSVTMTGATARSTCTQVACPPPPGDMTIGNVTASSFTTTVTFDQFGGVCGLFLDGQQIGVFQGAPGLNSVGTANSGILPNTTYQVCCANICADGATLSDLVCLTVTTDAAELAQVNVAASDAAAAEQGSDPGVFTFTRDVVQGPLTVFFTLSGQAANGVDYDNVDNSIVIPDGESSFSLFIVPNPDGQVEGDETVVLTLNNDNSYLVGPNSRATILITDEPEQSTPGPPLTPPQFIDEANFYATDQGELACYFPDPNSDGSDRTGLNKLVYVVQLEDPVACEVFIGPVEIDADEWPTIVKIPGSDIPTNNYLISVRRRLIVAGAGKRNEDSGARLAIGPDLGAVTPPTSRLEYNRWLLHLPRKSGGFDGLIQVINPNRQDAVTVLLGGYSATGEPLTSMAVVMQPDETRTYELYGSGANGLFADFEDQISHLAIWDRTSQTTVSLQYLSRVSDYGVWVDEVNLKTQQATGSQFEYQATSPSDDYFDGIAVLNLTSEITPEIVITRVDPATGQQRGQISLGTLEPGHKRLNVLSGAFTGFIPNAIYTIEAMGADQGAIQVLGLSGRLSNDFLNSARIVRKR